MERRSFFAYLSFVLALGVVAAAILGPLVLGVIEFHLPEMLVNQYLGGEVATVVVAAPMLVSAGVLWLRDDPVAPVLAFGPAVYTVYTFVTAVVGQEYLLYEGNAERAFPLYAALIAGGLAVAAWSGAEIVRQPAPALNGALRRATAGIFLAVVLFFALSWSSQIAQVYRGELSTGYVEGPTLFWLIKLMDLAFLLPAFAVIGAGVLRRNRLATRVAYGAVSYAMCMVTAVLGMAVAMWLKDDPSASVAMIAFLVPVTIGFVALAGRLVAGYRRASKPEAGSPLIDMTPHPGQGHA